MRLLSVFNAGLGFVTILTIYALPVRANPINIPKGRNVLLDGRAGRGEWSDARRVEASVSVTIYLKRDSKYLYVGIEPKNGVFSVDLYFDHGRADSILNLHASAKLGERRGAFGQWPEWSWWNNNGWAANVIRVGSFETREFLADEIKEYQIELGRLESSRVWLSADVQKGEQTDLVPASGETRHGRRWLDLKLKS